MHGQAREPRQDRKVATVTTSSQCRGVPGHFFSAVITAVGDRLWAYRNFTQTGIPTVTLWPVGVSRPVF